MPSRGVRRAAVPLRVLVARRAIIVAGLLAPAALAAQKPTPADTARRARPDTTQRPAADSTQRTHTVKRGDTLWDLAKQYIGDPFQWPEIYRLNRDVVENPHWIYPGEVLRIPGAGAVVAEAPPEPSEAEAAPSSMSGPTVFGQARPSGTVRGSFRSEELPPSPRVRAGEYLTAPWVDERGGPKGSGRIIQTADIPGISQHGGRERLQDYDQVVLAAPRGSSASVGTRYVVFGLGPWIDDVGQIVIPTGVVEVTEAPRAGEALAARVVAVYGDLRIGQGLVAYDTSAAATTARPTPMTGGPTTKVRWIASEPVLPSVQSYVVLDATARQGLKLGDEVTLFKPRVKPDAEQPLALPEVPIATAEVIRVTSRGTTVLVTHMQQPKIEQGTMARVSAKMP